MYSSSHTVDTAPARAPLAEPSFSGRFLHAAWRLPTLVILLLVMIVSGCEGLSERTGQATIDRSFTTSGFSWEGGGIVYVFVKAGRNQGKVEICAAFMPSKGAVWTSRLNTDVLGGAIVNIDGTRVMRGISFAREIALTDDVKGQQANCARGSADWKPGYAGADVEVKYTPMKFVI